MYNCFFYFYWQVEPKEDVEHADILELNTIIDGLRQEKEILQQEKVEHRLFVDELWIFNGWWISLYCFSVECTFYSSQID